MSSKDRPCCSLSHSTDRTRTIRLSVQWCILAVTSLISCDISWVEAWKRDKLWRSQPIRNRNPLLLPHLVSQKQLFTFWGSSHNWLPSEPAKMQVNITHAHPRGVSMEHQMPHSPHSYPGYLCDRVLSSDLIGFPKLLNIVFSWTNKVIKGSEHF